MSFDGILLSRLAKEFEPLISGRISKITEYGNTDFIFTIRANKINYNLMLSFSSEFSRIHLTKKSYDSTQNPKSFTMFIRKQIEGYFIESINVYNNDRVIYFTLAGFNEMQDFNKKYLICEIMGRYSNMILCNEDFKIIEALKHDGVGEFNRTILPNAKYEFPINNKLNPLDYSSSMLMEIINERKLNSPKDYMNTFNGISLNIAYPIFEEDNPALAFCNYLKLDNKPCIFINFKGKQDFYFHPLNNKEYQEFDSISALLDEYYYKADMQAKVKLKTNDLLSFVHKQINKNTKKIIKLNEEKQQALELEQVKLYGELLLSKTNIKEKKKEEIVFNYYTGKEIAIPLDPRYTILENSNRYFKKYQKMKNSIKYIEEQINHSNDEIEYFKTIEYQLSNCTINEALEIQDELINQKYLFRNEIKNKKKTKIKPLAYILENGTIISLGKNNLQNEELTHKISKPNDLWFHVKNAPGSHVVIHKDNDYTEEEIRTASMLAAYYSTLKDSSSIAVDYTKIRNIKKIPGKRACFVTYTHQKTIYIDIDEKYIENLKVKK